MSIFKNLFGGKAKQKTDEPELDGSAGNLIVKFQNIISHEINWDDLNDVEFAMWLPSETDNRFSNSEIIGKWTEIFNLTSNYWSYITADLLKLLQVIGDDEMRMALPEENTTYALLTNQNEQIILSISVEKGIRFHFASTTSFEYRMNFMNDFLNYCKGWKSLLTKLNEPPDENIGFSQWWELTVKASKMADVNEPILAVGKIIK
ncbi:MAG: hypothetical protein IPI10_18105 [Bacteroidetes bacterium]|nr:hypothetical protein [Bacteroidota bacterium]